MGYINIIMQTKNMMSMIDYKVWWVWGAVISTLDLRHRFDTPSKAISFLFLSSVILLRGRNVHANN